MSGAGTAEGSSIWRMPVPLGVALLIAGLGFLLGMTIGGFGAGFGAGVRLNPLAADHPAESAVAKLLVWGHVLAIGWGCRGLLRGWITGPRQSLLPMCALAFGPVALADMAAFQFSVATSGYQTCAPGAVPLPPTLEFLPRTLLLGSAVLLALIAWGWHLTARAAAEEWEMEPIALPSPLPAGAAGEVSGASDAAEAQWLDLPEAPMLRLRVGDVALIRSAGNYSEIVAAGRVHMVRATLTELATRFAPLGFVRVHRQAIVNARQVRVVFRQANGRTVVQLACGTQLPLGRRYRAAIDALG